MISRRTVLVEIDAPKLTTAEEADLRARLVTAHHRLEERLWADLCQAALEPPKRSPCLTCPRRMAIICCCRLVG